MKFNLIIITLLIASNALQAQCWPTELTHDTRPTEQWLSCTTSENRNAIRQEGLWIMYDFGFPYELGTTHIWNYNVPRHLENGITRMAIDYSMDGRNWDNWGDLSLDLASGRRDYEGQPGPDLTGITARYILITALQTGNPSMDCAGLAEVRFNINTTTSTKDKFSNTALIVAPNPTDGHVFINLPDQLIKTISIYNSQGQIIQHLKWDKAQGEIDLSNYASGIYWIKATVEHGQIYQKRVTLK